MTKTSEREKGNTTIYTKLGHISLVLDSMFGIKLAPDNLFSTAPIFILGTMTKAI